MPKDVLSFVKYLTILMSSKISDLLANRQVFYP